jgi:hypothetical protein
MNIIEEYKIKHLTYSNVLAWHNAGFRGQGVNILNLEDEGSKHSDESYNSAQWVAPLSKVFRASKAFESDSNIITRHEVCDDGVYIDFEKYIADNKIKIITFSMTGAAAPAQCVIDYWNNLAEKYNLIILNSAGNDGSEDDHTGTPFSFQSAMQIGAIMLMNGTTPLRAPYSSIGYELDFMNFTFSYSGTSFSCPYTAGECALIVSRYGLDMTFSECYKYLQFISKDLGDVGFEVYNGWGLPIMPNVNRKYIELTLNKNTIQVDGLTLIIDTPPIIDKKTSRTLVPLRIIAEQLGAIVTFDSTTQMAKLVKNTTTILIKIGANTMKVNNKTIQLDAYAQYNNTGNRLLVPIRAIAEAFNCKVDWVQSTQKVMILEN